MYNYKGKEYPCCTSLTMGLIGGKWKTVILYYLMDGTLRYNELRKKMESVTERTLSLQLKALVEDGLVARKVYTSKPPLKVEYTLTEFGETLIPLIRSIADWGDSFIKYLDKKDKVNFMANNTPKKIPPASSRYH